MLQTPEGNVVFLERHYDENSVWRLQKKKENFVITNVSFLYSEYPVNTDTKGTCQSLRIIRLSVKSGRSEKHVRKLFMDADKSRPFCSNKPLFNFLTVTVTSSN